MNHVVDGTSFWHFWNIWSQIHRAIHDRWIPDGYSLQDLYFPFANPEEFLYRQYKPPKLQERFFHFSSETIAKLKAKANEELINSSNNNIKVSSFQALVAFIWKSVIQAKGLNPDQLTHCKLAANYRTRLEPPLPQEYFGNLLGLLTSTTTVSELLEQNLGWTAALLHQSVADLTSQSAHDFVHSWLKSPFVFRFDKLLEKDADSTVQVGSSPRFDMYGNEFVGLGKPIGVRSGYANKFDGKL